MTPLRPLRPLRLLVPGVAILAALGLFLGVGFIAFNVAGDRDSLGLFQQRPSQDWGAPSQVTNPVNTTTIFIERLLAIPGRDALPVTVAAQTVQRSAFPNAYAKWEGLAAELVQQLADVVNPAAACAPTAWARSGSPTCGGPPDRTPTTARG